MEQRSAPVLPLHDAPMCSDANGSMEQRKLYEKGPEARRSGDCCITNKPPRLIFLCRLRPALQFALCTTRFIPNGMSFLTAKLNSSAVANLKKAAISGSGFC